MKTAWDVPTGGFPEKLGILPSNMVQEWASEQANLSTPYQNDVTLGVSASQSGRNRKDAMLKRVEEALETRSNLTAEEIGARMQEVSEHLEDPGLLKNFEYFDVPSSDFMLQFYFAVWDRRIAELMCYLHNYGKDLKGVVRHVPEDDIWFQMSRYEGMNINERKKASGIVDYVRTHDIKHATSFGGGNIPERFYDLMAHLDTLTVFDDGPVSPLEELFPDEATRNRVNYVHESLASAPKHPELLGTQQLVWMHGVSMYLDEKDHHELTGAILAGISLLSPHGVMKYDYLLWTESMRRVIQTQNWPNDPRKPMVIFTSVGEAIASARQTISAVNFHLGGKAYMELLDPEVTLVEPWGVTSVRITIKKHA